MDLRFPTRRVLVGLTVIAVLAGCASGSSPTPAPATPTPTASSVAVATPTPTVMPTATPAPTNPLGIPDRVGTLNYPITVYTGDELAKFLPFEPDVLAAFLEKAGKTRDSVFFARAWPTTDSGWPAGLDYPSISVIQVPGTDARRLSTAIQSYDPVGLGWPWGTTIDIGGKSVVARTAGGATFVLYPKGDTLYWVSGVDLVALAAVVAALP